MFSSPYVIQLEKRIQELENRDKESYVAQLESTIKSLEKQIENLTEMIRLMHKQKYGSSSEKTKDDAVNAQLNLFNEAET